jgi:hypothetical protein
VRVLDLTGRASARCAALGLAFVLTACSEKLTAPGSCPDFCQSSALTMTDTILPGAITQDSAFGRPIGYVDADAAVSLLAVSAPWRDSRPIFRTTAISRRLGIGTDTATATLLGVDSARLTLTITRRDAATPNLTFSLYALPLTIDTATAFHDLDAAFAGPVLRSVNLDSLLAKPADWDPATGDSAIVDNVNNRVILTIGLDSAQVPLVPADTGKLAFGIRVTASGPASVAIGASENAGLGPVLTWFVRMDSLGVKVIHVKRLAPSSFDSFVYDPPSQPIGSSLVVGGVPAARTILRFVLPRAIRDSSRIVRATLEFIAAAQFEGTAADAFPVIALPVVADFGAKSPTNPLFTDTTTFAIAPLDTVRINVTHVLGYWSVDPRQPTTLVLRQLPEGTEFAELRVHSATDVAQQPRLHITYAPRYPISP